MYREKLKINNKLAFVGVFGSEQSRCGLKIPNIILCSSSVETWYTYWHCLNIFFSNVNTCRTLNMKYLSEIDNDHTSGTLCRPTGITASALARSTPNISPRDAWIIAEKSHLIVIIFQGWMLVRFWCWCRRVDDGFVERVKGDNESNRNHFPNSSINLNYLGCRCEI